MGVGAVELDVDVLEASHGADAQLPVTARMSADERHVRKAPGQQSDIARRGFSALVAASRSARLTAHLKPGVNVNQRIQLGGLADDLVVVRVAAADAAAIATVVLDAHA